MKAIVLDMYGVIIKQSGDDFHPFVQKTFPDKKPEEVWAPWAKANIGEITSLEVFEAIGFKEEIEKIEKEYLDTLELNEGFVKFINAVKDKYRLAIISNDLSRWSEYLREKFDLNQYFEVISISGDLKMKKPEKPIFLHTIERLGLDAKECYYVDDREENLDGAKKVGMHPILLNSRNVLYDGDVVDSFDELMEMIGV